MALDWRTVERIKKRLKIPLAIKGIATAEDAKLALDHGVETVSYTHLDVYKRQGLRVRAGWGERGGGRDGQEARV